jgi:hypothetical protein
VIPVLSASKKEKKIFMCGSETPLMYRSKEKLKRMATGRLYTHEEAENLGRERKEKLLIDTGTL